jgi:hypothetical protein
MMLKRTSVTFSDDVTTHEIPKLDKCQTADVYYSRSDYKKFQNAHRIRVDRNIAKQVRRMIEDASATLEAHDLELAGMQTPVDDLLLVKPPSMPVRQVSRSMPTPVALSKRPSMPVRKKTVIVKDVWTENAKVSVAPTRPVRQASQRNVHDMPIEQVAVPESLGSLLERALAV